MIVASSMPRQVPRMPWKRAKALKSEHTSPFNQCFRIQRNPSKRLGTKFRCVENFAVHKGGLDGLEPTMDRITWGDVGMLEKSLPYSPVWGERCSGESSERPD